MATPSSTSEGSSSLDDLRTVEFRQSVRGYHTGDVDEYLERVAADAQALQDRCRQSADGEKQSADRIGELEEAVTRLESERQARPEPQSQEVSSDALQRTLALAQKFVDQTQAEAEADARAKVAEAEAQADQLVREAENRARDVAENARRQLREEVARLEAIRTQLTGDVDTIGRHLENERRRLRWALGEMLSWVDEHVQPAPSGTTASPAEPSSSQNGTDGESSDRGDVRSVEPPTDVTGEQQPSLALG